jgi:hypothetical protein
MPSLRNGLGAMSTGIAAVAGAAVATAGFAGLPRAAGGRALGRFAMVATWFAACRRAVRGRLRGSTDRPWRAAMVGRAVRGGRGRGLCRIAECGRSFGRSAAFAEAAAVASAQRDCGVGAGGRAVRGVRGWSCGWAVWRGVSTARFPA